MPELNTIRRAQLAEDVWAYVTGLTSGAFPSILSNYLATGGSLGLDIVYTSDVDQTISGDKTFVVNPYVGYTGTSGQVVAKAYIDDEVSDIYDLLTPLSENLYVYRSGDQTISGNKIFAGSYITANYLGRSGFGNGQYGINLTDSTLVKSGGSATLNWDSQILYGVWNFVVNPSINGGTPVLTNSNQTISGDKTFAGTINVPLATQGNQAVGYTQLQNAITALADFSTGDINGFAGVASLNGQSGHIFSQGRGSVTCWQQGNIFNISGAVLEDGSSIFHIKQEELTSGNSLYRIDFETEFNSAPFVFIQLGHQTGSDIYGYTISGVDVSGFTLSLSEVIDNSGYFLNYIAADSTGIIAMLRGEQGIVGPYLQPRGAWDTGNTYGVLDWVTVGVSAYVARTGHVSTTGNTPSGANGATYWDLLTSGLRGVPGLAFAYAGEWNSIDSYSSGESVTFSGASYGTLSDTTQGQSPTGDPWFVIAAKGNSGLSFIYQGEFNSGINYSGGDVVTYNHTCFTLTDYGQTSSGQKYNPDSYFSNWEKLQDRSIVFTEGGYQATKIYYKNDLAYISGNGTPVSIQYINTSDTNLRGLHPASGIYNSFVDCSGNIGYNLFSITVNTKDIYNPNYGEGSPEDFSINEISRNAGASGFYELVLLRGQSYYFDNEFSGAGWFLATDITPPYTLQTQYNGSQTGEVITGSRLLVDNSNYQQIAFSQYLLSGTLKFTPNTGTPDTIYLVNNTSGGMYWKLNILDSGENPWHIFTSGLKGDQGEQGEDGVGSPGLAFSWRGDWETETNYFSGEAVFYSGSSYATNEELYDIVPPNAPWFLVAQKGDDGPMSTGLFFNWQGDWSPTTQYEPRDAVYWKGTSYGTLLSPSGVIYEPGLDPDIWSVLARSGTKGEKGDRGEVGAIFQWRGNYSSSVQYLSGEAVYYNGNSYGTTGTTSGFAPSGGSPWDLITRATGMGFTHRGEWSVSRAYYSGDVVSYLGSSFAVATNNQGITPSDSSVSAGMWHYVAKSGVGATGPTGASGERGLPGLVFDWKGDWVDTTEYASGEAVYYNGSSYGTTGSPISGVTPADDEEWFLVAKKGDNGLSFVYRGLWEIDTIYAPYDSVYYEGKYYAALDNVTANFDPTEGYPWDEIVVENFKSLNYQCYLDGSASGNYRREWIVEAEGGTTSKLTGLVIWPRVGPTDFNISGQVYYYEEGDSPSYTGTFVTSLTNQVYRFPFTVSLNELSKVGILYSGGGSNIEDVSLAILGYSYRETE